MKIEFFPPDSVTEPRHWVRHDQAFAMMLGTGSIEWGSKRSLLEKFDYAPGNLAICERHIGEWVGLVNVPHLHLGISDAALMASSDGAYGEVELRACRKFANPRLSALVAAAHAEMVAGFPSGLAQRPSCVAPVLQNGDHGRIAIVAGELCGIEDLIVDDKPGARTIGGWITGRRLWRCRGWPWRRPRKLIPDPRLY